LYIFIKFDYIRSKLMEMTEFDAKTVKRKYETSLNVYIRSAWCVTQYVVFE